MLSLALLESAAVKNNECSTVEHQTVNHSQPLCLGRDIGECTHVPADSTCDNIH